MEERWALFWATGAPEAYLLYKEAAECSSRNDS